MKQWVDGVLSRGGHAELKGGLVVSMRDGVKLMQLISTLARRRLPRQFTKRAFLRTQRLDNVELAIRMAKRSGVSCGLVHTEHVVDGDAKMVLGLIWSLFKHFGPEKLDSNARKPSSSPGAVSEATLKYEAAVPAPFICAQCGKTKKQLEEAKNDAQKQQEANIAALSVLKLREVELLSQLGSAKAALGASDARAATLVANLSTSLERKEAETKAHLSAVARHQEDLLQMKTRADAAETRAKKLEVELEAAKAHVTTVEFRAAHAQKDANASKARAQEALAANAQIRRDISMLRDAARDRSNWENALLTRMADTEAESKRLRAALVQAEHEISRMRGMKTGSQKQKKHQKQQQKKEKTNVPKTSQKSKKSKIARLFSFGARSPPRSPKPGYSSQTLPGNRRRPRGHRRQLSLTTTLSKPELLTLIQSKVRDFVRSKPEYKALVSHHKADLYNFGTKRIQLLIINGELAARVGGGYVSLLEFCQKYGGANAPEKQRKKQHARRSSFNGRGVARLARGQSVVS